MTCPVNHRESTWEKKTVQILWLYAETNTGVCEFNNKHTAITKKCNMEE